MHEILKKKILMMILRTAQESARTQGAEMRTEGG